MWWVPLTYTTRLQPNFQNTKPTHWLEGQRQLNISIPQASSNDWVIFNIKQTGTYPSYNFRRIILNSIKVKRRIKLIQFFEVFESIGQLMKDYGSIIVNCLYVSIMTPVNLLINFCCSSAV